MTGSVFLVGLDASVLPGVTVIADTEYDVGKESRPCVRCERVVWLSPENVTGKEVATCVECVTPLELVQIGHLLSNYKEKA